MPDRAGRPAGTRVLPDENLPRGLQRLLHPHVEVRTVQQQGWSGHSNGRLLAEAAERFDVLVTVDHGIPHHHDLREYAIGLVVPEAASDVPAGAVCALHAQGFEDV